MCNGDKDPPDGQSVEHHARRRRWLMVGVAGVTAVAGIIWLANGGGLALTEASNPVMSGNRVDDGRGREGAAAEGGAANSRPTESRAADGRPAESPAAEGGKEDQGGGAPGGKGDQGGKGDAGKEDGGKGDGDKGDASKALPCDPDELIAALNYANANGGGKIRLATDCSYTLTANEHGAGLPKITQPVEITGEETTITRAADTDPFRIFTVGVGGDLTLRHVTLKNGRADDEPRHDSGSGGGGGGAILVKAGGRLHLEHSAIRDSTATVGGGISNAGTTTLSASTVSDNIATDRGGGIHNEGSLVTEHSHLTYNKARYSGGALENSRGTAELKHTAIGNNVAGAGGGIRAYGDGTLTTVRDSTISDNTAVRDGGGVHNDGGPFTLFDTTISRNTAAGQGGGVLNTKVFVAEDTVINANRSTQDDGGGIASRGGKAVLRRSEVTANKASGPSSVGGGILNEDGILVLTDSRVIDNSSTRKPGGVFSRHGQVEVDQKSVIIKNRPTNCVGSPDEIPNCFG